VKSSLDIFEEAGGKNIPLILSYTVTITDGFLSIQLADLDGGDTPKMAGIQVSAVSVTPTVSPAPSIVPSILPSAAPSKMPSSSPSAEPSKSPTVLPTDATIVPETDAPTPLPTASPKPSSSQTTLPPSAFDSIRINCGDGAYTDSNGNIWEADDYFENNGGMYSSWGCENTPGIEQFYCSERYWNKWHGHSQPYRYEIPVPVSGAYQVDLHFAETVS
jgi:hypothetical protein